MLKKTPLLNRVLYKTSALASADGRRVPNSNYFMAALYEIMDAYAAGASFEEAATPEGEKEFKNTSLTLGSYGKAFAEKRDALLAFMQEDDYSSMPDDLMFGVFTYKAEGRARKDGKESVDTLCFLSVVLAEPTAAIKKIVFGVKDTASAPKAEETAQAPEREEEKEKGQ